ncbi:MULTISPECIES: MerR family transcriptional regulator [Gracilibacillus]|uniref:MerR family transcriptional regulator n=1 Tax=Gracilibacillus TaxID=74385 RepID=UPI0024098631|nr:MerR family transcriptional regulator [Gracilibacillus dipsosauri]
MGELSKISNVSKRTIDYYTKMGLLECVRSDANYRLYKETAMEDLQFIEKCKQLHLPLEQIKQKQKLLKNNEMATEDILAQVEQLKMKMKFLKLELEEMYEIIDNIGDENMKMKTNIQSHSSDLMRTLVLFSN